MEKVRLLTDATHPGQAYCVVTENTILAVDRYCFEITMVLLWNTIRSQVPQWPVPTTTTFSRTTHKAKSSFDSFNYGNDRRPTPQVALITTIFSGFGTIRLPHISLESRFSSLMKMHELLRRQPKYLFLLSGGLSAFNLASRINYSRQIMP